MYPPNESKTAFIIEDANFCHNVMPFGLKNVGATYLRLMDKVFKDLVRENVEVYVDDMVVKSSNSKDHPNDLAETFAKLRRHNIWLNPKKCVFRVWGGKFSGFKITCRGIEANPNRCEAVIAMRRSPQNLKKVQKLTSRLVSLSRFLPKMAEKEKPFLKLLKQPTNFQWNQQCEAMFSEFKTFLASSPILTRPTPKAELLLYLSVSDFAISLTLLQEEGWK